MTNIEFPEPLRLRFILRGTPDSLVAFAVMHNHCLKWRFCESWPHFEVTTWDCSASDEERLAERLLCL